MNRRLTGLWLATADNVRLRETVAPGAPLAEERTRDDACVFRDNVTVVEEPLSAAVTVAVWSEEIAPVVAVNVVDDELAGTFTEVGTVKAATLSEIATAVPPAGAAAESVTVQVVLELANKVVAVHWSEVTRVEATRDKLVVWDEPFSRAVMVAV